MAAIWSEEAKLARWLEVELAALEGWAELGAVPREAVDAIRAPRRARRRPSAWRRSRRGRTTTSPRSSTRSPSSSATTAAGSTTGSRRRTSSTRRSRCRSARRARSSSPGRARAGRVAARAEEHRETLTIGRTHGVHAEPTTFGLKLAGWAFELERERVRVARALEGMRVGKLSGAVGTYSASDPEVERVACERLGLEPAPSSTQILQRDRHAEVLNALAQLASSLERFAIEIRHLARTEVREVEEPFGRGQKGSSAMPHKRNPIVSERICGLARVVRAHGARRPRERRALARARHLALLGRADRLPRRVPRDRLHARPVRLADRGARRPHRPDAREPRGEPRPVLQPAAAARARRVGARARRGVPARPAARAAGVGRGPRLPDARPRRRRDRGRASTSTRSSTSARTRGTSTSSSSACARCGRSTSMPEAAVARREREGARALRARRRAAAARRLRPHLDLRRDPADADPRQGPRADRPLGLLVRAHRGHRPEPPARASRRRPLARVPAARDAADRGRRARLPRPARAGRTTSATGAVCGHELPRGLRESDRLPEPIVTPATKATSGHDENIAASAAAALVGAERYAEVEAVALALYRLRGRARGGARHHPRRHEVRARARRATAGSSSATRC